MVVVSRVRYYTWHWKSVTISPLTILMLLQMDTRISEVILETVRQKGSYLVLYQLNFPTYSLHLSCNLSVDDAEHNELDSSSSLPCFLGKQINLTEIPKYVREYDRGNDVEIWEIKYQH